MSSAQRLALARQHIEQGRYEQARAILTRVLAGEPRSAGACSLMGYALGRMGQAEQALHYARRAVDAAPADAGLLLNLGNALVAVGRVEDAIEAYSRCAAAAPDRGDPPAALGRALLMVRRLDEALQGTEAAWARHRPHAKVAGVLAEALLWSGQARRAMEVLREAMRAAPADPNLARAALVASNYAGGLAAEEVYRFHRAWGEMVERHVPRVLPPPGKPSDPDRPLRVGFLSGDLREHAMAFFIEPLLVNLAGPGFTVIGYSTCAREDATSMRMRQHAGAWRHEPSMDALDLARLIRRDAVDVLIDFSGHTDGNRLLTLHQRPAPVQVTYLGYPNTTGLKAVDWRMVDSITDPPPASAVSTERLWRLDPCFLCYGPPADAPAPTRDAGRPFTFGSFNNLAKLDDDTAALYAGALKAAPGSRLLLRNGAFAESSLRERVLQRLVAAGLDAARVDLEAPTLGRAATLAAYSQIDVMLDSFPYHGTTTTCEALFMGVPVVTLMGDRSESRVSGSIVSAVGHPECATGTPQDFAARSAMFAHEGPRTPEARASLRSRFTSCPAGDSAAFGRRVSDAIRGMWRDACATPG